MCLVIVTGLSEFASSPLQAQCARENTADSSEDILNKQHCVMQSETSVHTETYIMLPVPFLSLYLYAGFGRPLDAYQDRIMAITEGTGNI
jgi:hypothetical protein